MKESWNNSKIAIKAGDIVDYLNEYGKNIDSYTVLTNKLTKDMNRYNKERRAKISTHALEMLEDNLRYMDMNMSNTLDYLCIIAGLERRERTSITKYQFLHLFNKMLKNNKGGKRL